MEKLQEMKHTGSPDIEDQLPDDGIEAQFLEDDPFHAPLPEAGGVAWIDLYGQRFFEVEGKQIRKVFKISLTARATSPTQALDKLKEAIDHAEQKYGLRPYPL